MAKTRYANTDVIDDFRYATWQMPVRSMGLRGNDLLQDVRTFEHVIARGERVDHLAARYFGDAGYWWVICLANDINYPFSSGGWTPGKALRIPYDVKDILDKVMG